MTRSVAFALACAGVLASHAAIAQPDLDAAKREVFAAERAFARSMAERDFSAFLRHLSAQAVFFNGAKVLNGKAAVADGWRHFFNAPAAPFSWQPDQVEVLTDCTLALSSRPVRNPAGQPIARFNSVWRLEAPGSWCIVFDKGEASGTAELDRSVPSPVTNQRALQKDDE